MTEKKYRKTILKLGGTIKEPALIVDFPDTLRINSKGEAVDLLDILINNCHPQSGNIYTVDLDVPFMVLKRAIKKGVV